MIQFTLNFPFRRSRCLKITEKSHSTIASEASYVYIMILSGQKLTKNAKNGPFWRVFEKTWSLQSNSVTRQVSFNRTKIGGKWQNSNATFWVIFKHCVGAWKIRFRYQMGNLGFFFNFCPWYIKEGVESKRRRFYHVMTYVMRCFRHLTFCRRSPFFPY